jgi:hypothetical protein
LADSDLVDIYGRLSVSMKLNGIIFGKAVGKVTHGPARRVPNNNYGAPVDASEVGRAFWFVAGSLKRKVRRALRVDQDEWKLATDGSWPNWQYFVEHSPSLARLWSGASVVERERFADILGFDPWTRTPAEWSHKNTPLFLRLIMVHAWMRQRRPPLV